MATNSPQRTQITTSRRRVHSFVTTNRRTIHIDVPTGSRRHYRWLRSEPTMTTTTTRTTSKSRLSTRPRRRMPLATRALNHRTKHLTGKRIRFIYQKGLHAAGSHILSSQQPSTSCRGEVLVDQFKKKHRRWVRYSGYLYRKPFQHGIERYRNIPT